MKNARRNLKRLGAVSLVLAQIAATGIMLPTTAGAFAGSAITRNMENLDRGVVAVQTEEGVFLSWRRLATESADTNFEVYRNKEKITEGAITNYVDSAGTINDFYTIVCNGTMSESVAVLDNNYIEIPLHDTPDYDGDAVMSRDGITYGYYMPGDSTYGDLDGDGEYEIVMLWNPSDAKDAASGGRTGKVYMDAYKLDGTFMWRIDMGWNIRAGAHDTQLCVADFDNDGRSEVMVRTADGTVDGQGNVIGDASKGETYESSWAALNGGKNLQGPLYVTCFDGETGAAIDTIDYFPNNSVGSMTTSLSFGDDFGNRSERYNATIAYLDGTTPSAVFCRGYYMGKNGQQRMGAAAYSLKDGKLSMDWSFDTNEGSNAAYVGQGNHNVEAADVDGDGCDEVTTGALVYDQDGSVLWCSTLGHGDAMHVGDFTPENEGLEIMLAHEEAGKDITTLGLNNAIGIDPSATEMNWGITLQDAKTGQFIQAYQGTKDTGRGMIGNIGYGDSYYVMWGAASTGYHDNTGEDLGDLKLAMNGRIYWDGDLQDEIQDHVTITKWNDETKQVDTLFAPEDAHSINGTKGNVNAQGDLLGDWREEIVSYVIKSEDTQTENMTITGSFGKEIEVEVSKTKYQYALRLYTTTIPTEYNFYTLAHDDVYRNSSGAYNNCYNQPPHISWYMNDKIEGSQYTTQPAANVKLVSNKYTAAGFDAAKLPDQGSGRVWTPGGSSSTGTEGTEGTEGTGSTGIGGAVSGITASPGLGYFYDCVDHWSRPNIDTLYSLGYVDGVSENMFNPDATITKGEFLKIIVAALGIEVGSAPEGSNWAVPYYAAAVKAGILPQGMDMKATELDQVITREEMAALVCAAAISKGMTVDPTPVEFTDADSISDWAATYVYEAANLGIIEGYDDLSFNPQGTATRAEACAMLARLVVQF